MPEVDEKPKEKGEDRPVKSHKRTKSFLSKVVIRKLPPNLNAESFLEMISPLPDHQDIYFCAADWTLGAEATSRAYIEFKHEEDVS
jgi:regulator of nonsense transcripts 3